MKEVFYKISSILIALLVLFSSFSFTVNKHICGGEVVDVSYFTKADSCGMDSPVCENNTSTRQKVRKEPCCDNHSEIIQGNDNIQQAQSSLKVPQIYFLAAFGFSYISLFDGDQKVSFYKDYSPPLVVKNIYKLDEVYLI